jgi:hypothetical protein
MIWWVLVLVVLGVLLRLRARRKATLAGLNGERPTFAVEPPRRRVGDRRTERL